MILVTGATGFVGGHMARQLAARGMKVRALVRNPKSIKARNLQANTGCELIAGNILDRDSLDDACTGVNAVIHLVGIIHETPKATFESIHKVGTLAVIRAAERAGIHRFLHMSALGTRPYAPSPYHQSKWDAEQLVRGSTLDATIFRPAIIFGPGDHLTKVWKTLLTPPCNWLTGHALPMIDDGSNQITPVHVNDVVTAFINALANPQAVGKTYELGGQSLPFRDYLEYTARALGLNPTVVETHPAVMAVAAPLLVAQGHRPVLLPLPSRLAKVAAGLFEILSPIPLLTPGHIAMLEENQRPDTTPAVHDLGFSTRSYRDSIETLLATA